MRPAGTNVPLTESEIAEVKEVYADLHSYAETGKALNISAGTVSRIIRGIGKYGRAANILQYKRDMAGTYTFRLKGGHAIANAGIGSDWFTVYLIETEPEYRRQGEATRLLEELKLRCRNTGRAMRIWHPMNLAAKRLCEKLNIETTED